MRNKKVKLSACGLAVFLVCIWPTVTCAQEQWRGVDEAVVEKIAAEHGKKARSLTGESTGDLNLFIFLIAGVAGGFAAGYYWRMLLEGRPTQSGGESDAHK